MSERVSRRDRSVDEMQKKSGKDTLDQAWTNASKWEKENIEDHSGDAIKIIDQAIEIIASLKNREEAIKATAEYLAAQEIDLLDLWEEDERLGDYLRTKKGMEGNMNALRSAMELARLRDYTEPDERLVSAAIGRLAPESPEVVKKPVLGKAKLGTIEGKPIETGEDTEMVVAKKEEKKADKSSKKLSSVESPKDDRSNKIEQFLQIAEQQKITKPDNYFNAIVRYNDEKEFFTNRDILKFERQLFSTTNFGEVSDFLVGFFHDNPSVDLADFGEKLMETTESEPAPEKLPEKQKPVENIKFEKKAEEEKPAEINKEEKETSKRRPGIREFVDAVVKLQTWEEFINILAAVNRKKQFFNDGDFDLLRKNLTKSREIDNFHQTLIRKLLGKLDKAKELGEFIELYRVEYDEESAKHEDVEEEQ